MLTESRQPSADVGETELRNSNEAKLRACIEAEPFRFHFFQLVRLIEKLYPEHTRMGKFTSPLSEPVRFTAAPSLSFPPSQVSGYKHNDGGPDSVEVAFMGLNVINGPMPRSYTETLLERKRAKDRATLAFFDLFNHRMLSLFYRAWARYRLFIAYERAEGTEHEITERLYDLIGMGTPGLRDRMDVPDESALFFAGLLGHKVRSVEALRQILEEYFGVPISIRQFTGAWATLPREQLTVLQDGQSPAECLGMGTVLGGEVWNSQGRMTVRLGPMPLARYQEFLPGAPGQKELESWLRFYSRRVFDFVIQLVLARDEVPRTPLSLGVGTRSRLSYESWLKVKPMRRDPDETTYLLQ